MAWVPLAAQGRGAAGMAEPWGKGGLVPWAQGQHLAPDLGRVCLIPDKEATPGTWLANRHSGGNGTEGSTTPPSTRQHPCQDHLLTPLAARGWN